MSAPEVGDRGGPVSADAFVVVDDDGAADEAAVEVEPMIIVLGLTLFGINGAGAGAMMYLLLLWLLDRLARHVEDKRWDAATAARSGTLKP